MNANLALIGFGEAASTFAKAANWKGGAYDILGERRVAIAKAGLIPCERASEALLNADIVLSLVTADQSLSAAGAYAPLLKAGAIWCDMNSVAPSTKLEAALAVEAAGARYVDVAILAPVNPAQLAVPLLISGSCASEAAAALAGAGFKNVRAVGSEIGRASTIKMVRSIMVKGIEALTGEMMAAANAAGVAEEVLASLDASERAVGWVARAAYNLDRMETHGLRRAAEMEEVAKTLRELGIEPVMTKSTIVRQCEAARHSHHKRDAA